MRTEVLAALQPRNLSERLQWRLIGGLTAAQVLDRLPPALREALQAGHDNPTVARRDAIGQVAQCLVELVEAGQATRARVRM